MGPTLGYILSTVLPSGQTSAKGTSCGSGTPATSEHLVMVPAIYKQWNTQGLSPPQRLPLDILIKIEINKKK